MPVSLRELTLIGIVFILVLLALVRPKYGLYGYLWYALMRPDVLCYVEDERNIYSLVIFGATALGSIRYIPNIANVFRHYIGICFIALQVPFTLSVSFAVYPDLAVDRFVFFIKAMIALLLIPMLIETIDDLKELYLTIALSLGFVGIKYGLYGVVFGGVELARGYGPMLGDNNFVAMALATVMPLCWFGRSLTSNKIIQYALLAEFVFCIPAIVMTNSRGGILSMGVVMLFITLTAKGRIWLLLLILAGSAGSIYLVQDMFTTRMATLSNVEEEASAASRLWHLNAALRMSLDHPILGVGFGGYNYAVLSPQYDTRVDGKHVAHNSYAQVLADSGIFAFVLYAGMLFGAIYSTRASAKRMAKAAPALWAIPNGLCLSLIAFALGSTFYSCQRMDLLYMLLLTSSMWLILESQIKLAPAPQPAPGGLRPLPHRLPPQPWGHPVRP